MRDARMMMFVSNAEGFKLQTSNFEPRASRLAFN